jgi:hypothetical protein
VGLTEEIRRRFALELNQIIGDFHAHGLVHLDLKQQNLVVGHEVDYLNTILKLKFLKLNVTNDN